ncbi:hypothetical protein [Mesoterricola silvestris]|uniref:Cytochrome b561 domain-containing protein n=1 Tax=Mesoterricola silvestris TaxID=2927979 RepID=A0AA48GKJ8_9BACT|nr:hypothetical protein [Mesoterricola silvestris]BDU73032.1 hypothetical protein METEAL_22060 [Mesoterricola silvestris]
MNPLERLGLHLSAAGMGVTGLLYGWLKYFHQRAGDFGPEPYRLQAWSQHAHVFLGPLLVFTLGLVVRGHVAPALESGTRRGRRSGLWVAAILAPMILSGYGMQICVDPGWRAALAWVHGPSSLLFLAAYGFHLRGKRRRLALLPQPAQHVVQEHVQGGGVLDAHGND